MFTTCRKIWLDTTTFEGHYVAKDVRGAVSFLVGLGLLIASASAGLFGKTVSMEPGTFLLVFSLGNQTVKEYFKYKNNAVASDCPNAEAPVGDPGEPRQNPE